MGTRGLMGLVIDGDLKVTYNHFDSYPAGLGHDIAAAVLTIKNDRERYEKLARDLVLVDESEKPTLDQQANLLQHADFGVSTQTSEEWYVLLRNLQGDLLGTLSAGYMIDSHEFASDSLFCEWGYVVNFDTDKVEVYRGFNHGEVEGRFAEAAITRDYRGDNQYSPITLVAELDFESNMTEGLDRIEAEAYAED